jgi:hypothetical protein
VYRWPNKTHPKKIACPSTDVQSYTSAKPSAMRAVHRHKTLSRGPPDPQLQRHLSPCNITRRLRDHCPPHPAHPFCRSTTMPCSNRSGWKAGAIEIGGTREGSAACGVMRCGTGQRGCQLRDMMCRRCPMGAAWFWFHLPFGRHERGKGKNIVNFCISVLPLSSPSFTSSSSSSLSVLEAVTH